MVKAVVGGWLVTHASGGGWVAVVDHRLCAYYFVCVRFIANM
jgi:hypothetical protein